MRFRPEPIDFLFRDPKTWTKKEHRTYRRWAKWQEIDMKLFISLSGNPCYQGKLVAIFHGKILAADVDHAKVIDEVECLGGTALRQQTHFHYIYPPGVKLIMDFVHLLAI